MNDTPEEAIWQRLSKALFGGNKTTDEGLFTYGVMERVRTVRAHSGALLQDLVWHHFLRWAVPMLGVGVACLILAAQLPIPAVSPSIDTALFQPQTSDADPLSPVLENF